MEMVAATRPSGPVLSIPNYGCASPNRVKLATAGAARSPAKSVSVSSPPAAKSRRSCTCSPTNHPGSFRCSLHKDRKPVPVAHSKPASLPGPCSPPSPPPSAVVPTGAGAGVGARNLARRAIAPSQKSQNQRRLAAAGSFRPRPSRLSAVSFAGDNGQ